MKRNRTTYISALIAATWPLSSGLLYASDVSTSTQPASDVSPAEDWGAKTFNLRIKPLGLIYGIYGGELQVAAAPWLALGASIDRYTNTIAGSRTVNTYEYSAIASLYLWGERFHGGWLVQPGYHYAPTDTNGRNAASSGSTHDYYLTATVGREWAWRSGFNIHLGLGIASDPLDSSRTLEPLAVWQLGFAI